MTNLSRTIPQILIEAAERFPEKTAIQDANVSLSYQSLLSKAQECAQAMMNNGLEFGDRFALWAPNIHEWVWTAIGGMMAGGILVPLNTRYRGLEAGDILRRSKSKLLFTTNGFLDTDYVAMLESEELPDLENIVLLRGERDKLQSISQFCNSTGEQDLTARFSQLNGDSTSDILYTSGTTGAPKGVVSSHGQTIAIFETWSNTVGLNHEDRYLIVNPFFHSFGYKAGWLSSIIQGATALPMAIFNPSETLKIIEQEKITVLPGAPTIFQTMLADENLATTDTSSLRCSVTGAATVPEQLVHDMKNVLGFDEVFTAYGLTECPVVSITHAGDPLDLIANTAGSAIAGTQTRVLNDQGEELAANEVGNIMVRGYNVMQAYFNDAQASQDAISADGWLTTGDLGWQNEQGYIKVTDRAKDMFITGGFNCYPAEIENLLLRHPEIVDAAVTGIPDERMGEVACAYLVSNNRSLNAQDLTQWSRQHMANFKVPRSFILVAELPRNASGKVMKFKLSELDDQIELSSKA